MPDCQSDQPAARQERKSPENDAGTEPVISDSSPSEVVKRTGEKTIDETISGWVENRTTLRIGQFFHILGRLTIGTWAAIVIALASYAGFCYDVGVRMERFDQRLAGQVVPRVKPPSLLEHYVSYAAHDGRDWVVALTRSLEIKELPGPVVEIKTVPFPAATTSFELELDPTTGGAPGGYFFRVANPSGRLLLEQLIPRPPSDGNLQFSVPECEKGDTLLFIIRLDIHEELPSQRLPDIVNLRVLK